MTSEFGIAVHALVFLNHKQKTISSDVLADNVCTNPARIRKVMAKLKKSGLIQTKEGADGGYQFVLDPRDVTLAQICEAVGVRLVSSAWRSGDIDKKCLISSGMGAVMEGIYSELNGACMRQLQTMTVLDIDKKIFLRDDSPSAKITD